MQLGFHLTPFFSPAGRSPTQILDDVIRVVQAASTMGYAWVSTPHHWLSYPTMWPQPYPLLEAWTIHGSPQDCLETIARVQQEIGLEYIGFTIYSLPTDVQARIDYLYMIAEEIVAKVTGR